MIIGSGDEDGYEVGEGSLKKGYHWIEMGANYPFGQLRQIPTQLHKVLVRKKLLYSSKGQENTLLKTASMLQRLRHPNLINLHHIQRQLGAYYFCYEYAHLTIESWLLDLGDDMLQILKDEMISLSTFLSQNRIVFNFTEQNLGLSSQMHVQYFLHEFTVVEEKQEELLLRNQLLNRQKISRYFQGVKEQYEESNLISLYSSQVVKRETGHELSMFCSVATRESWQANSPKKSRIKVIGGSRSKKLNEKVEKSKAKTSEILYRLKNIRNLQF